MHQDRARLPAAQPSVAADELLEGGHLVEQPPRALRAQVAAGPVTVDGCENINTSYPGFVADLAGIGGRIVAVEEGG